ncbi:biotin--[acetyl-CoA-carboxylase] ligase [Vagococcus penaei]|uniref:Bifunctional ligase/repressor BirA n=1 Tax=Vagococcus penaei TaxID=633807 RepID=A0A1Q2D7V9_9ENTE|nr:biotin--[acetyl-CoA-carboxylase] ligase [Vagococcus penaei]AQP54488.1 biotin--[acetyl-CoA-carboxylase] ligase [Vagococcus penaei]RSU06804.1 biotin--[acetyl-CoA-carboxylase] ligase [Vagococcus penaei]
MKTKDYVLDYLEQNKGTYVSGSKIAEELGLSRNAVWKSINVLKNEGFQIKSKTNNGYCLLEESDKLTTSGVAHGLNPTFKNLPLYLFETIDSTNKYAKELAIDGIPNRTVVLANEQTNGRGRYGKTFESPADTGVYISLILKPSEFQAFNYSLLTLYTAVSIRRTIFRLTGKELGIKWVNDLFLGDRKICGILTEAITNIENQEFQWLIIGIGLNVSTESTDFSDDVKNIAGSLFMDEEPTVSRNELVAGIINDLLSGLNELNEEQLIAEYDRHLLWKNQQVTVYQGNSQSQGFVRGINQQGHLLVETETGDLKALLSGDVSIKR